MIKNWFTGSLNNSLICHVLLIMNYEWWCDDDDGEFIGAQLSETLEFLKILIEF